MLVFVIGMAWFYTHEPAAIGGGPGFSRPIALGRDVAQLAVVNPDANTVTIFQVQKDQFSKGIEVSVCKDPSGRVFDRDGTRRYVANGVDGAVSVVAQISQGNCSATATIPIGTAPNGVVLNASGNKLSVNNPKLKWVSVIDIKTNQLNTTIPNMGPLPRGIAITDGANITG